jgi:hypothetical protein
MNKLQGVAALAASLFAAAASGAAEPELPAFKAYDQLTYTLVTHDPYTASEIPGQTARIDAFLTQQLATPVHTPSLPTRILVIPELLAHRYFEVDDDVLTDFVPARFTNFLLLEHSRNSHAVRFQLFHQYTHAFMRSQMKRYCPLWLEEGMATVVQASRFQYTKMEIGMPIGRGATWIPIARLLQLDRSSPEYRDKMQIYPVRHGSWSLVHLAFIEDPAFNKQLFDFLAALNNLNPIEKAVPKSFGMSLEDLDLRMRRYVQQTNQEAIFEVKLPPVPPPKVPPSRNMSEVESLELIAEAMLEAGTRPERLPELIDAAHRKAPDSSKVLALRMQLAARGRDDAALDYLLAQIEPRIADVLVARAAGVALFERVREIKAGDTLSPENRNKMSRRAFELLDRVVMSKPDDVEAIWGYAMLAARLKQDLPTALRRLDSGFKIADNNPDLAMAAALVYEARGELKQMIPFLVVTARMTRENKQREWAINRVNEVLASQAGTPAATK